MIPTKPEQFGRKVQVISTVQLGPILNKLQVCLEQ